MKKFLIASAILLAGIFILQIKDAKGSYVFSYSVCDTPLTYSVGSIDKRFGLTDDDIKQNLSEAAGIWNDYASKPIFIEKTSDTDVTVNFVYDKRQALNSKVGNLEGKLDTDKASLDPRIDSFNAKSKAFEEKVAKLNETITYWNNQGGAPKDEYEKIVNEQAEIEKENEQLRQEALALRQSTKNYNSQVSQLNQTILELKNSLVLKPEEGLFDAENKTITIFLNNTKDELIHTLAHELGHARGLGHVGDEKAIMYVNSSESTTLSNDDKKAMDFVCQEKNYAQLAVEKYLEGVHYLRIAILKQIKS